LAAAAVISLRNSSIRASTSADTSRAARSFEPTSSRSR
jgi:hypothetical protein